MKSISAACLGVNASGRKVRLMLSLALARHRDAAIIRIRTLVFQRCSPSEPVLSHAAVTCRAKNPKTRSRIRSYSISINDCDFDFQTGQKVLSAGWLHIAIALKATFEVLDEILGAPEVKAIPAPIRDHYYIEQEGP